MAWTWRVSRRMLEGDLSTTFDVEFLDDGVVAGRKLIAFAPGTSRDDAITQFVAVGKRFAQQGVPINVGETGQVR